MAEIGSKPEESKPHPIYSAVRDRSQDLLQIKLSAIGFQLSGTPDELVRVGKNLRELQSEAECIGPSLR